MDNDMRFWANTIVSDIRRNSGYLARQEIERLNAKIAKDPKRLEPFGFKVYSQNDEDGILEEIFRRLKIYSGKFCEIGVSNGLECNTLYMLHNDWVGSWVEADKSQEGFIKTKFAPVFGNTLIAHFEKVTMDNINDLVPPDVDFLSIDVDGNDYYLWKALKSKPPVVCVEYNAKFGAHAFMLPPYNPNHSWDGTDYMGSSFEAICELGVSLGYRLVATNITGANAFFVRHDLAGDLFSDDHNNLFNPPRYYLYLDHFMNVGHPANFGVYNAS